MERNLEQNFHPENIPDVVAQFKSSGEVPVLGGNHFDGGQCRIYRVYFHDGESWAVRIPIHVRSDSHEVVIAIFRAERDVLQEISQLAFPWAPTLLGSSLTFDNLVGFPIIALSWMEGSPLR